jgi:SAM-dependent methyltransferase
LTDQELDLSRWREHDDLITDSLWLLGPRDRSSSHSRDYWGNFVPQIPNQVLRRFTRRGDRVVDLFSGLGTTLIECRRLGRCGVGVELNPEVAARSRERIAQADAADGAPWQVLEGDSADPGMPARIRETLVGPADCVFLHPPYHDIIKFGDDPRDLSNAPDEIAFLDGFSRVVASAAALLRPGGHLALVIGDVFRDGEVRPLGFACMERCRAAGLALRAINVKDIHGNVRGKGQATNLWRYRALRQGLYVFKHEYVMLFRSPLVPCRSPESA